MDELYIHVAGKRGQRILFILDFSNDRVDCIVRRGLEQMKEFADTVTAMVAEEEERQERIAENEQTIKAAVELQENS